MEVQKAKALAAQLCERTVPCTLDELAVQCRIFPVTSAEIRGLCELPDSPLLLVDDVSVFVKDTFAEVLFKGFYRRRFDLQRLNGATKRLSLVLPLDLESREVVDLGPQLEQPISSGGKIKAVAEKEAEAPLFVQVDGAAEVIPPREEDEQRCAGGVEDGVDGRDPQGGGAAIPAMEAAPLVGHGNKVIRNKQVRSQAAAEKEAEPPLVVQVDGAAELRPPREEDEQRCAGGVEDGVGGRDPQRGGAAIPAMEAAPLVGHQIRVIPNKQKSRESKTVPQFKDFAVEREVGAGGYGTVYKVRRHVDGHVFAMKCPLANTHDSCVQNEINMLKKLRGKDCVIKFEREVTGKSRAKPEAGKDKETDCPSILLEFIEHDKPEVLKKEITIVELRRYSSSLFTALAELHSEKILHLDVKPGNFLFSRSTMKGYLVDFNLARVESQHHSNGKRRQRAPIHSKADALAKPVDRAKVSRKRPSLPKEPTTQMPLKPSKRCRQLLDVANIMRLKASHLGTPPGSEMQTELRLTAVVADVQTVASNLVSQAQSKRARLKSSTSEAKGGDVGNSGQKPSQQSPSRRFPGHCGTDPRLIKHAFHCLQQKSLAPATPSTPSGVPASTAKVKGPPDPLAMMPQVPTASRAKAAALKPKGPQYHAQKDGGPCVGTKGYRAPEVLMRAVQQTTKVDMWSAGVSLLQMVTGRLPFHSTTTEGALREIAELRGSAKVDALAKSLGQSRRFSKERFDGSLVKDWSEKNSKRPDLHGAVPSSLYDLIERCLDVNPKTRISAREALRHQFLVADSATPAVANDIACADPTT